MGVYKWDVSAGVRKAPAFSGAGVTANDCKAISVVAGNLTPVPCKIGNSFYLSGHLSSSTHHSFAALQTMLYCIFLKSLPLGFSYV